jgi:hypothetical protein
MRKVYAIDGVVVSLEHLNKIRAHMEEAAAKEYKFSYTSTRLSNIEYLADKDQYNFTLEFLA